MKQIQVFRAGLLKRKWAFRFVANGEVVAQSELYSRRIDAKATAELVATGFASVEVTVLG